MSLSANAVLHAAERWRNHPFSTAHYGTSPYCASFVRWCFETATGIRFGLPEVSDVPYYHPRGIHVAPGKWFADSLAGNAVGPVVSRQQPGDLLFFHDTCDGPWPKGSITHVGIAIDAAERMADAGSGSVVHFRSHQATFPNLLAEIRRPTIFAGSKSADARRTAISVVSGHAFGMVRGNHVRDMTIVISRGAPAKNVGIASNRARSNGGVNIERPPAHSKPYIEFFVNQTQVKPVQSFSVDIVAAGQHLKQYGHDHVSNGFLNGAVLQGDGIVKVELKNGEAHVWLDGKEVKAESVKIELMS